MSQNRRVNYNAQVRQEFLNQKGKGPCRAPQRLGLPLGRVETAASIRQANRRSGQKQIFYDKMATPLHSDEHAQKWPIEHSIQRHVTRKSMPC